MTGEAPNPTPEASTDPGEEKYICSTVVET